MDIFIRPGTPDDAEAVVGILNPIIETGIYTVLNETFTVEQEREFLENFVRHGIFNIAEIQSSDQATIKKVVGFQTIEKFAKYSSAFDHVGISGTYVDLDSRRLGVGTKLFEVGFDVAKRRGLIHQHVE